MEKLALGDTGIMVSPLVLGTWEFALDQTWGEQDEAASIAAVRAALDAGVNFFDTAERYGNGTAEKLLGKALAGRRLQAVIASKVYMQRMTKSELVKACEESLERLGTDYIDCYQIHWPSPAIPLEETMEGMRLLIEQGKIRSVGVCNFGVRDLEKLWDNGGAVYDQLPYSLLNRAAENEIFPACKSRRMAVMAYSPMAMGLLSGKYRKIEDVPVGRMATRFFNTSRAAHSRHGEAGMEELLFATLDKIAAIADSLSMPMKTLALAWMAAKRDVDFILFGARNAAQLRENIAAVGQVLDPDLVGRLDEATVELKKALGDNPDLWQGGAEARIH